jgi:hypothetical protein
MDEFDLWDALSKTRSALAHLTQMIAEDTVPPVASAECCFWHGEELKDPRKVALLYQIKRVEDTIPIPQMIRGI